MADKFEGFLGSLADKYHEQGETARQDGSQTNIILNFQKEEVVRTILAVYSNYKPEDLTDNDSTVVVPSSSRPSSIGAGLGPLPPGSRD